jgi:peroxiredoxin
VLIVVLPSGTFAGRRREVEAKLGSLGKEFNAHLVLTEDYTGSWQRAFDAKKMPSTYLMNSKGAFVWKEEGAFNADAFVAALDKYLPKGRVVRSRRLNLAVQPGERPPRALFADDFGQRLALRKLRGHPVLLNFWQSWSAPCIRELERLQTLYEKGEKNAPTIVAVNCDANGDALAEFRRKHKIGFVLVHDANGSIARSFGVNCWPTTLSIDPDGFVNGIQLGTLHDHGPESSGKS